jgi:hypothetical protein
VSYVYKMVNFGEQVLKSINFQILFKNKALILNFRLGFVLYYFVITKIIPSSYEI